MQSDKIRDKFLKFFEKRGHIVIPSAPLVPENDPSVLFNTAGMQPLVPYLLGQPHPAGKRIVNIQKCVRTQDIDEVGDNTHDTFFQMLGNWSLGDYFKQEAITWSYELLTSKEEGFGLDPNRLYITIFEGDNPSTPESLRTGASLDEESKNIWQSLGIPAHRIYSMPADSNWWSPGDDGPCGPDTEMFYDLTPEGLGDLTKEQFMAADQKQQLVEIWNDVFMEYDKESGRVAGKLEQRNVDTGAGLERLAMVLQKKDNIFDTDLFQPIMDKIAENDPWSDNPMKIPNEQRFGFKKHLKSTRILADHIRTAVFMVADGVTPSNTDRGYILRRLLRRSILRTTDLNLQMMPHDLVGTVIKKYKITYPELSDKLDSISKIVSEEETKFLITLKNGLHELRKMAMDLFQGSVNGEAIDRVQDLTGKTLFTIFSTYGFPFELSIEKINEIRSDLGNSYKPLNDSEIGNLKIEFDSEFKRHQALSRSGAEQKFKGGLADSSEQTIKYHTATHLLNQALHDVLGDSVEQRGSNITAERLRYDFTYGAKMTDDEKKRVEEIVNEKIKEGLPVQMVTLLKEEALKTGARHVFTEKYADQVNIYFIGHDLGTAYSKEFCGGPHVTNTNTLGHFKIVKEEAVAAGIRRIKAVLD